MISHLENDNRRPLRARYLMDRHYWRSLDIDRLADVASITPSHFIRSFKNVFGGTPHRYLQRRRVERGMYMLRTTDRSITEICMSVGFSSLGTFGRTFTEIVGETLSSFRRRGATARRTFETLSARGVDVSDEPSPRPYGIDFGDPRPVRECHPHRRALRKPGRLVQRARSLTMTESGTGFDRAAAVTPAPRPGLRWQEWWSSSASSEARRSP